MKEIQNINKVGLKSTSREEELNSWVKFVNDPLSIFMCVIGHMKVKDQRRPFEFLDRGVASVVYKSCHILLRAATHVAWRVERRRTVIISTFFNRITILTRCFVLFFLFWTVFSNREELRFDLAFSHVKPVQTWGPSWMSSSWGYWNCIN